MEARINVDLENINVIPGKKYRMSDIARIAGVSYSTARESLTNDSPKIGKSTRSMIREIAARVGFTYSPRMIPYKCYDGIFSSKEEEVKKMLELREKGFGNKSIAKKVGRSYTTVLLAIGKQPNEITKMEMDLASEHTARKNLARREYFLNQKITKFEAFQKEAEAINAKAMELEAQAQKIADEAKAVREQYSSKVIEMDAYRKEVEKAAKALGRNLA